MRNIELKARLADLDAARKTAVAIATERLGTQHQVDTYFHCRHGRLKLRQIDRLMGQFAISPADLLARSYGEMVA